MTSPSFCVRHMQLLICHNIHTWFLCFQMNCLGCLCMVFWTLFVLSFLICIFCCGLAPQYVSGYPDCSGISRCSAISKSGTQESSIYGGMPAHALRKRLSKCQYPYAGHLFRGFRVTFFLFPFLIRALRHGWYFYSFCFWIWWKGKAPIRRQT